MAGGQSPEEQEHGGWAESRRTRTWRVGGLQTGLQCIQRQADRLAD